MIGSSAGDLSLAKNKKTNVMICKLDKQKTVFLYWQTRKICLTGLHCVSSKLFQYNCSNELDHFDILVSEAKNLDFLLRNIYLLNMTSPS